MSTYLIHHGIKGQKWGVRRFQNSDGTLTEEGKRRKGSSGEEKRKGLTDKQKKAIKVGVAVAGTALAAYGAYRVGKNIRDKKLAAKAAEEARILAEKERRGKEVMERIMKQRAEIEAMRRRSYLTDGIGSFNTEEINAWIQQSKVRQANGQHMQSIKEWSAQTGRKWKVK